jgi:hypothetical protein
MDLQRFLDFDVFSYMKPFEARRADDDPDNYYMEREWRVVGKVPFTLDEVYSVFLPSAYAERLRSDVPDYGGQVSFV